MKLFALLLLCFVSTALGQFHHWNRTGFYNFTHNPTKNLYPITANGFDTVILQDLSYITEISYQNFSFSNGSNADNYLTFFIFGNSGSSAGAGARTVYDMLPATKGAPSTFYVADAPPSWGVPFVDIEPFMNFSAGPTGFTGDDSYFIGTANGGFRRSNNGSGYNSDITLFSTLPGNFTRFFQTPIAFQGTYYAVSVVPFSFGSTLIAYFVGFFEDKNGTLMFGVNRAFFNTSALSAEAPVMSFDPSSDTVALATPANFVTFNADFKPFIFHIIYDPNVPMWNLPWANSLPPNTTWTYVVDPFYAQIYTIEGSFVPGQGLANTGRTFVYPPQLGAAPMSIVSAAVHYEFGLLIVGLSVPGLGTGALSVHYMADISGVPVMVNLPVNMSNPRALVIDQRNSLLYVGVAGEFGGAILKYTITKDGLTLVGQQPLPFYLMNVWTGVATPFHVYFATNEQVAKVFRVAVEDFCPAGCMEWGYCSKGHCVCQSPMAMVNGKCDWPTSIKDRETIKKDHGGEVALGILFMLTTIAAAVFGFLWYRGRRHSYTSV
jgi:hypothetical protein